MKPVYKFFVPLFVLALMAISVVGVAFARHSSEANGGSGEFEIVGTVEAINDSTWTIDGKVYQVTPATEIKGLIQPGARVKVHVYTGANGALTAREIELAALVNATAVPTDDRNNSNVRDDRNKNEIFGTVEAISATAWKINGKVYRITPATEIKGAIQAGSQVKVHLYLDADGVLTIREVELAGMGGLGSGSSGDDNSAGGTSGDDSPGDDNSGDDNSGDDNSGDDNSGDDNSGDDNSGDDNSGDDNDDSSHDDDDDHDDDDYDDNYDDDDNDDDDYDDKDDDD